MKKMNGMILVLMLSPLSMYGLHTEVIFHNERDKDVSVEINNTAYKTTLAPMQYIKPGGKFTFKFSNYDPLSVEARIDCAGKETIESMKVAYKHYYIRKDGKIDHSKALAVIK